MKKPSFFTLFLVLASFFVISGLLPQSVSAQQITNCDGKTQLGAGGKTCSQLLGKSAQCRPFVNCGALVPGPFCQYACISDEGELADPEPKKEIQIPNISTNIQKFNPLNPAINGSTDLNAPTFNTPADVINRAVKLYAFPAAGLILFVMIVWGGFEMVSGATNTKSQDAGKQRITAAVVGFGILFAAYWLIQLVQAVFGIKIF